jgi:hypothetical protein
MVDAQLAHLQALHPSFPVPWLPALPEGFAWVDPPYSSIPSARDEARGIEIRFDHPDPAQRDANAAFFTILAPGEAGRDSDIHLMTDDWSEILTALPNYVRWQVGERVALRDALDVFNFPKLPAGTTGTIVGVDNSQPGCNAEIRLDVHVPTLDEWENVLQICDPDHGEVTRDLFRPA